MGFLFRGRFAQVAEFISILLILVGIIALCQPFAFGLFQRGFGILLAGWIGLTFFSHRKPYRLPGDTDDHVGPTSGSH